MLKVGDLITINYSNAFYSHQGLIENCQPGDLVKVLSIEEVTNNTRRGSHSYKVVTVYNYTNEMTIEITGMPSFNKKHEKNSLIYELFY